MVFTFGNGTLGAAGTNFGLGVNGQSTVGLQGGVTLNAAALQVGDTPGRRKGGEFRGDGGVSFFAAAYKTCVTSEYTVYYTVRGDVLTLLREMGYCDIHSVTVINING